MVLSLGLVAPVPDAVVFKHSRILLVLHFSQCAGVPISSSLSTTLMSSNNKSPSFSPALPFTGQSSSQSRINSFLVSLIAALLAGVLVTLPPTVRGFSNPLTSSATSSQICIVSLLLSSCLFLVHYSSTVLDTVPPSQCGSEPSHSGWLSPPASPVLPTVTLPEVE